MLTSLTHIENSRLKINMRGEGVEINPCFFYYVNTNMIIQIFEDTGVKQH